MIISAFPGSGKTYLAAHSHWKDLESATYLKLDNWVERYINDVNDVNGDVLISQRPEVLARVRAIIVAPKIDVKETWLKRLLDRGYKPDWFDEVVDRWAEILSDECFSQFNPIKTVRLDADEHLSDIIGGL